jgi:hypothetical protein
MKINNIEKMKMNNIEDICAQQTSGDHYDGGSP